MTRDKENKRKFYDQLLGIFSFISSYSSRVSSDGGYRGRSLSVL
jgi:hypothetical protein